LHGSKIKGKNGFDAMLGACHANVVAPGVLLQSTPRAWDFRFTPWRDLSA